jgi:hypothetical protein
MLLRLAPHHYVKDSMENLQQSHITTKQTIVKGRQQLFIVGKSFNSWCLSVSLIELNSQLKVVGLL